MKIKEVKINGITNPKGFHLGHVICSWKVTDTVSKKQTNAVIEVSTDEGFEQIVCRKEGAELKQQGEALDLELKPRTTYYYRITITGDQGDKAVSEIHTFETGKMNEAWRADWITTSDEDEFHPVMRKSISISKNVKRARIYGTGVGMFEMYLNKEKLGEEYLAPYINNYETNIQVLTFSADALVQGENELEILLGKGWYMGVFGLDLKRNNYGSRMAAIAELHIEYEDGTKEVICTDENWEYRGSSIEDSGIYDGEILNELLWEGKENPWKLVTVLKHPEANEGTKNLVKDHLMDRLSLPVLAKEKLHVQEVIHTPAGETVLDFGQNFAGFVEFEADLPKGTKITMECAEILQEGNFYHGNYRDAKSTFTYISDGRRNADGRARKIHPHFTFFGLRYLKVTGWPGECKKEQFTGHVLYSDIDRVGYIKTSDEKVNRLYENTVWGLKSNFIDMPTDCPQRSERLGWTGDAQVFAPTASYHTDTRAFFRKFAKDLRDEQRFLDGGIANYLPNIGHKDDCGSGWGDIATFLPNTLYTYYGSLEEMEEYYPMMHDWVDYIDRHDAKRGRRYLFDFGFHFGDWLALDGPTPTSFKGSTDDNYIGSVYYYRSAQIVREMAERLGKVEDAKRFKELEEKIFKAVLKEYFTPSGRLAIDTQAAYVIALKFHVHINRQKLIDQFKLRLQKDCNQIKCGFVGAPLLCTVLGEAGMFELAYDFLLREEFPGWLYAVNLGATTVWERWNSVDEEGTISRTGMNSLNHYAYGSVMEFVYAYAAGIHPLTPGFGKAVIAPHPDIRLRKVECSFNSVSGNYVCNFEIRKDGKLQVQIEIPFGCEAVVELPGYEKESMNLDAGTYEFCYVPAKDYRKPYSKDTTLYRLAKDERAMEILGKYTPGLAGIAASGDSEFVTNTLEDVSQKGYLPFELEQLNCVIAEVSELMIE